MKIITVILVILSAGVELMGQFHGGLEDGFARSSPILITLNEQGPYCQGGSNGGFANSLPYHQPLNSQVIYCMGAAGDGFDSEFHQNTLNNIQFYCIGGFGDGTVRKENISSLNNQLNYCMGNSGDGYDSEYQIMGVNNLQFYCIGGFGDGTGRKESISSVNGQCSYCTGGPQDGISFGIFNGYTYGYPLFTLGGTADGFCQSAFEGAVYPPAFAFGGFADGHTCSAYLGLLDYPKYVRGGTGDGSEKGVNLVLLGPGIWTGKKNTDWLNTGNWKHHILPGLQTNVLIPSGCIYYPLLTKSLSINSQVGDFRCNRLDILTGGRITGTSIITINGIFNVSGTLTTFNTGPVAISVESGGILKVMDYGTVILEH